MNPRFSFLLCALTVCTMTIAQVRIRVDDPATWSAQELLPYVGKTVIFDEPMVICSNGSSSLTVAPRRLFAPTNQARPRSEEYKSVVNLNATGAMNLSGVPYRLENNPYRCGEKIYNLEAKVNSTSSLTWINGVFKGNKRADLENMQDKDIRAMVNVDGCNECLLVCTMNLEYYLAVEFGSSGMGPSSYAEHQKQRAKTSKALKKINADLYGFVEIQQGQQAVAEIASDLNTNLPGRNYTYINDGGSPDGSYTKSAFVYDRNKLRPIGSIVEQQAGNIQAIRHRMICFEDIATHERFIFSVNHFKAKSGSGMGKDADQGDGQGGYNASRQAEAQTVADLYKTRYRPQIKEKDILIMGDLNAYGMEDPIMVLVNDNGMIDLHRAFHADSSYSYQFGGMAGYLDHAICNGTLYPQVTGAAAFHINSDELDKYTYDKSNDQTMFRSSDHDPVLVGLKLDSTLVYDPSPAMNSYEVFTGNAKKLIINNAYKDGKRSFYAIYDISGVLLEQEEIKGYVHEITLPTESGMYVVYVYSDGQAYQRKLIVR